MNTSLQILKSFPTRTEAQIAQEFLRAHDIETILKADDAGGLEPNMNWSGQVLLLIDSSFANKANELLAATI